MLLLLIFFNFFEAFITRKIRWKLCNERSFIKNKQHVYAIANKEKLYKNVITDLIHSSRRIPRISKMKWIIALFHWWTSQNCCLIIVILFRAFAGNLSIWVQNPKIVLLLSRFYDNWKYSSWILADINSFSTLSMKISVIKDARGGRRGVRF